jgi:hypothetical protein
MITYQDIIKKYNLQYRNEYYLEIPNMGRDQLAQLFAELGFNKGVELGVWRGEYSETLCKANPNLHLYSIDSWQLSSYEPLEQVTALNAPQSYFDTKYREARQRLGHYPNCVIIKKDSMPALQDFEDNSLDFVYIDANHDFVNFTNDLHYWLKKVKPGGIMSGHDYCYYSYKKFNHVKRVIEAYTKCYRMHPYFVLGSMNYKEGTIRDKYRSWMWIKV